MAGIEELLRINQEQRKENEKLSEKLSEKIVLQEQQIKWLKQQLFGRKSEKFPDHPDLFPFEGEDESEKLEASSDDAPQAEEAEATGNEQEGGKKKRRIRRARLPENLPIVVIKEIIPKEVQDAPEEWREIGQEHSDQLEKEPGYFYIRRIVRRKYVRRDQPFAPPVIAPAEPTFIENGFWGAGLLSEILSNKYLYSLPLYRQAKLYQRRYGIDLSTKTMGDAVDKVSDLLELVFDEMVRAMIASADLQADETSVRYLDRGHGFPLATCIAQGLAKVAFWQNAGAVDQQVIDGFFYQIDKI